MSQQFSILGTSTVNQRQKIALFGCNALRGSLESKVRYAIKHIT